MRIYKYFHSYILLEENKTKILFDPGKYSFIEGRIKPENFKDISAILITHQHSDHLDISSLKIILQNNNSVVLTNSSVKTLLEKEGIKAKLLEEGSYAIDKFAIQAISAEHEKMLFPHPQNTAFVVNNAFLHPGDSFDKKLLEIKNVRVLALPITAPWAKIVEIAEFAKAIGPKIVIPVHDGYAMDSFLKGQYGNWRKYLSEIGIKFQPLNTQSDFVEI